MRTRNTRINAGGIVGAPIPLFYSGIEPLPT